MTGEHGMVTGQAAILAHAFDEAGWPRGLRVYHRKLGAGIVVESDGCKLLVIFDRHGRKRLLSSFVRCTAGAG